MPRHLPAFAVILGIAGLIPFLATAFGAMATTDAAQALRLMLALIAYAAVILAFLGGPHWGFVLATPEPSRVRFRLVLGVVPALVGWAALLIAPLSPAASLAILLAGFVGLTGAEGELRRRELMPPGYMALRWGLSIAVCLVLATVLVLHLVGARLIF